MILDNIARSLEILDKKETISLTVQAILEGTTVPEIILQGLFPGLAEVVSRYESNAGLYPDLYKATVIFQDALATIKHQIISMKTAPDVWGVIGVVNGDIQDFGKNMVHMTLEANGFVVKDLGKSVPNEKFLQAVRDGADFIAISIMTDEGVAEAKNIVQGLQNEGLRDRVKVIVGGAGVNPHLAVSTILADGYADDAAEVVEFLKIFFQVEEEK